MDKKHIASIWYFLSAFLLLTALQDYVFAPHVDTLSYGEFKTLVEKGKVSDLTIGAKVMSMCPPTISTSAGPAPL